IPTALCTLLGREDSLDLNPAACCRRGKAARETERVSEGLVCLHLVGRGPGDLSKNADARTVNRYEYPVVVVEPHILGCIAAEEVAVNVEHHHFTGGPMDFDIAQAAVV